jgi:hypothetical protein
MRTLTPWLAAAALAALSPAVRAAAPLPGVKDPEFVKAAMTVMAVDQLSERCERGAGFARKDESALEAWRAANGVDRIRARTAALERDPAQGPSMAQARAAVERTLSDEKIEPCATAARLSRLPDTQFATASPGMLAALAGAAPASPGEPAPPAPARAPPADAGELLAQLDSFGFDSGLTMGVGGFLTTRIHPVVLFKDGGALTDVEGLGHPGGLAAHRAAHPGAWTRWRRSGGELQLQRKDAWKKLAFQKTYPHLPAGFRLEGRFRALSGAGSVAVGGTDTVAAWSEYTFSRDGTVLRGSGAGGRAEHGGTAVATAGAAAGQRGRYQVDRLALEIAWEGGGGERRILVTDPADPKGAIWLDGQAYVQR